MHLRFSHYLPLITRCPVKGVDLGYITVETGAMIEIYEVRRMIHAFRWKKVWLEDLLTELSCQIVTRWPDVQLYDLTLHYRLMGGKVVLHA